MPVVAGLAQGSPIGLRPEKGFVTFMRDHMINYRGRFAAAITVWVHRKISAPFSTPTVRAVPVDPRHVASTLALYVAFAGCFGCHGLAPSMSRAGAGQVHGNARAGRHGARGTGHGARARGTGHGQGHGHGRGQRRGQGPGGSICTGICIGPAYGAGPGHRQGQWSRPDLLPEFLWEKALRY